ncbi:hypothetical protein BDQ17DRAFT_1539788 [Cyathus striatus]|nr:hypothetical protein BDQ17DRAFT_1539788 [Cyathus striatus]
MASTTTPILDPINNPFYCPAIPPAAYINALKGQVRRYQRRRRGVESRGHKKGKDDSLLLRYAKILKRTMDFEISEGREERNCGSVGWLAGSLPRRGSTSGSSDSPDGLEGLLPPLPTWEQSQSYVAETPTHFSYRTRKRSRTITRSPATVRSSCTTHKRNNFSLAAYTDLRGPPRYARSIQSFHESSFDVEVKRERLDYYDNRFVSSPAILKHSQAKDDSDLSNATKVDDVHSFIDRLDGELIPGSRIKERIINSNLELTFQNIVDFLAQNGNLTARIINIISKEPTVWRLSLSESMVDENGLNLCGNEFIAPFSKPDNFINLSELSFSGTQVEDFHLINIHHLPRLSTLFLNNTGIGNEAIFLLVPLKHTLHQLTIATNPHIDDESIPAILLLSNLTFLSILDTSITMDGLRRFSKTIVEEKRVIDIEIPFACEMYIETLETKYLLSIPGPLIIDPDECDQLSNIALVRNLAAHADVNPDIVPTGTRKEMSERLKGILRKRQMDLVVRETTTGDTSV